MSALDFNDADPQRGNFDLIPDGVVAVVVATLRPGGHGLGNYLKASNDGSCLMADFEFVIDGGEFDRRKFWSLFVTEGQSEGQIKAANISRSRLRAMLESAYGVTPGDDSPAAVKRRQVAGWGEFDGLRFCARIGVEKGKGEYKDRNVLAGAVTPDEAEYVSPGGNIPRGTPSAAVAASAAKSNGAAKPAWAS